MGRNTNCTHCNQISRRLVQTCHTYNSVAHNVISCCTHVKIHTKQDIQRIIEDTTQHNETYNDLHSEQCSNLKWVTFLHTVPLNISAPALVQTCHSRLWSKQLKVKTPKFCSMPYSGTGGQRLRKLRRSFFLQFEAKKNTFGQLVFDWQKAVQEEN